MPRKGPDQIDIHVGRRVKMRRVRVPISIRRRGGRKLVLAPDGTPLMAGGGGLTYSVKSRAKLPNGASTVLDATIRMGGIGAAGRPFVILCWRDGETS